MKFYIARACFVTIEYNEDEVAMMEASYRRDVMNDARW